ncbi:hypothetical protein ILUMI_24414 [Ignelater luminosus]|uniref:Peptidase aspartic putative domain-containing protein n=1 Tax=Ignelater luminosus TaxID=2038154 RepID=A0A8K0FYS6_IGNLU|nr:hypothetical protein ILUMI_24414 [Ignelater luminosus]
MPNFKVNTNNLEIPKGLKLADPYFYNPTTIDILLRAEIFWELLSVGRVRLGSHKPILQKTKLGWVIGGPVERAFNGEPTTSLVASVSNLELTITRFWELESITDKQEWSAEDHKCEQRFKATHKRNSEGRFIIELTFKSDVPALAGSNTLIEAKVLRDQVINILEQGQFSLNKWASNHVELLPTKTSSQNELIILDSETKTLGLIWD